MAIAADSIFFSPHLSKVPSPDETQLVEEVLAGSFLEELPARVIGDKAYDSDALDRDGGKSTT